MNHRNYTPALIRQNSTLREAGTGKTKAYHPGNSGPMLGPLLILRFFFCRRRGSGVRGASGSHTSGVRARAPSGGGGAGRVGGGGAGRVGRGGKSGGDVGGSIIAATPHGDSIAAAGFVDSGGPDKPISSRNSAVSSTAGFFGFGGAGGTTTPELPGR